MSESSRKRIHLASTSEPGPTNRISSVNSIRARSIVQASRSVAPATAGLGSLASLGLGQQQITPASSMQPNSEFAALGRAPSNDFGSIGSWPQQQLLNPLAQSLNDAQNPGVDIDLDDWLVDLDNAGISLPDHDQDIPQHPT